jgi:hypothetical protein
MSERAIQFGKSATLTGVVCEPDNKTGVERPAFVL